MQPRRSGAPFVMIRAIRGQPTPMIRIAQQPLASHLWGAAVLLRGTSPLGRSDLFFDEKSSVQGVEIIHHALCRKPAPDKFTSGQAEGLPQVGIRREPAETIDEGCGVIGCDEESGLAVEAHFRGPVAIRCDDGLADGEGLGQDAGEAFAPGQVDEDIGEGEVGGHPGRGHETGEDDPVGEPGFRDMLFESLAPGTIADEEDTHVGNATCECREGIEKFLMPLQFEEACDLGDDEIVGADSQLRRQLGIAGGVEERVEIETAEDAGVLVGRSDSGGEVLPGHGLRDRDEEIRATGRPLFG